MKSLYEPTLFSVGNSWGLLICYTDEARIKIYNLLNIFCVPDILSPLSHRIFTIFYEWGNWGLETLKNFSRLAGEARVKGCVVPVWQQAHFGKAFWDITPTEVTFPIVSFPGDVERPGLEQRGSKVSPPQGQKPGCLLLRWKVLNSLQTLSFWVFHLEFIFVYDVRFEM